MELTPQGINNFLTPLQCGNGRFAYYRSLRALCNWLYEQGHLEENPIKKVDSPKLGKPMLPSLTNEQINYLIGSVSI